MKQAKIKKLPQPYLLEFYNIKKFYNLSPGVRVIARIINALIEAIDERQKLPRFLLVILDKDILADLDVYDPQIVRLIRQMVNWVVKQIQITI